MKLKMLPSQRHSITRGRLLASLAACCLATLTAHAELRLADVFQDKLVLQRDKEVPVWGWADAGSQVTVKFGGQTASATASNDGKFLARLKAMPANANGQPLTVESGGESVALQDVLVGEVWIAAGQSNMNHGGPDTDTGVFPFYQSSGQSTAPMRVCDFGFGAEKEPTDSYPPEMRGKVSWDDINISGNSPIPYYFARVVRDGLDVPVGVIKVAVSGTNQGAWMSKETLEQFEGKGGDYYQELWAEREAGLAKKPQQGIDSWEAFQKHEDAWLANPDGRWPGKGLSYLTFCHFPSVLYNTRVYPLAPYAIRGFIWHQGEGGPGGPYGARLVAMFNQWREVFGQPDAYAIFGTLSDHGVSQPPLEPGRSSFYRSGTNTEIRKAKELANEAGDNKMEYVELYDLGNDDTHFAQKAEAGRRMGLAALTLAYDQNHTYTAPRMVDTKWQDGGVYFKFEQVGERLIYEPSLNGASGFIVIDPNNERAWGEVEVINADTIKVSSASVPEIRYVSYANASNPLETLFNSDGISASPFAVSQGDIGRLDEPEQPDLVKKTSGSGKIFISHVRRNGYMFEVRENKGSGEAEVQAYIPAEWRGFSVSLDGKAITASTQDVGGQQYAVFSAPVNGGMVTVSEQGQESHFAKINRY